MLSRQAEGIAAAKKRGVRFGRPEADPPDGFAAVKKAYDEGKIGSRGAGKQLNISARSFLRWAGKHRR